MKSTEIDQEMVGLPKNFPSCLEVEELCGDLGFNKRKLW